MIEGVIDSYTIVLSRRNHDKLGQLVNIENIVSKINLNAANEISFTVYKYNDRERCLEAIGDEKKRYIEPLWDEITNFKYIWVKELDEYYEITIDTNDDESERKSVTGISACEAELSQTIMYNFEVNTEDDIARDEYIKPTVFYNPDDEKNSLLHRALYKLPNYSINHVDETLWNIQRTFSASDTDVYSFLTGTVAEEIGCLFLFDTTDRSISVYDLMSTCDKCGYRGEYFGVCPECGSDDISTFGEDTTVYIDNENLATSITLTTNTDAVKNCFKLEAGDDDMTAAVINNNPNGSQYIYYFSEEAKHDMSEELVEKLESYDRLYDSYKEQYSGYTEEMYKDIDKIVYYTSTMMPVEKIVASLPSDPEHGIFYLVKESGNVYNEWLYDENNKWVQLDKVERYDATSSRIESIKIKNAVDRLKASGSNTVMSLTSVTSSTSSATVNSALRQYFKIFFNSSQYRIDVDGTFTYKGQYTYSGDKFYYGLWSGTVKLTGYLDKEDIYTESYTNLKIDDNYFNFLNNKVQKQIAEKTNDKGSIYDVLSIKVYKADGETEDVAATLTKFKAAIKYYSLNRLTSFRDAIQAVLDVLTEQELADMDKESDLYKSFYKPNYDKLKAVESEMNKRSKTISEWEQRLDTSETERDKIKKALDFEKYLGDTLLNEFVAFRREDTYHNDNYISDGLDNAEIFDNARKFLEVAQNEIVKSGEHQYSISSDIINLLKIKEFGPIKNKFKIGNWIRIRIDGVVYRLRLISYQIEVNNPETFSVEFSDVTKNADGINDIRNILSQASSMATSYGAITRQVDKNAESTKNVSRWLSDGFDLTNSKIVSTANHQAFEIDERGFWGRRYDDISDTYDSEQIKLINNGLYITKDNWESIEAGIGKIAYIDPSTGSEVVDYGLIAKKVIGKLILGEELGIYSSNGKMTFDNNGLTIDTSGGRLITIKNGNEELMYIDSNGNIAFKSYSTTSQMNSAIQQSASSITTTVNNELTGIRSSIKQNADNIELKVSKNGIISSINQSSESITINASKINLTGYLTISSADSKYDSKGSATSAAKGVTDGLSKGTTTINGGCITTGVIKSSNYNWGGGSKSPFTVAGTYIDMSTGYIYTPAFTVDSNGGQFSGKITSTSGSIGGWTIGSNKLSTSKTETRTFTDADKTKMVNYIMYGTPLTAAEFEKYDVNGDGVVNSGDTLAVTLALQNGASVNITDSIDLNNLSNSSGGGDLSIKRQVSFSKGTQSYEYKTIIKRRYIETGTIKSEIINANSISTENMFVSSWLSTGTVNNINTLSLNHSNIEVTSGNIYVNGVIVGGSDRKLKNSINELNVNTSEILHKFNPVRYKYNDTNTWRTGFIAQDVEDVYKEIGIDETYNVIKPDEFGGQYYGIDYGGMTAMLWKIVQEQDKKISELERKINV